MTLKPVNLHLDSVTLQDIENCKLISTGELRRDLDNLRKLDVSVNRNNFFGNPFLYHYQFKNLLRCRRDRGKTIYDIWADADERDKLIHYTREKNRGGRTAAGNVFECFRINTGSIVMFKASTAKYLYSKYGARHVLDPTAGWGGRMLGAWALGIDYTGMDTNIEMVDAYTGMTDFLYEYDSMGGLLEPQRSLNMVWQSCLDADFSSIDYDFVLTSPPYINMELYEHMTAWRSDTDFYYNFLNPLWQKCLDHIRPGGTVALNISPKMYEAALEHGMYPAHDSEDLKQQLGQQTGKKKQDKIYLWKK